MRSDIGKKRKGYSLKYSPHYVAQMKQVAGSRELFSVSEEAFLRIISENCMYCQEEATRLIKINSGGTYSEQNCLPICEICKNMRQHLTDKEFTKKIEQINYALKQQ